MFKPQRSTGVSVFRVKENPHGLTSSIVSRIAFGFPGRFIIKLFPLNPAVCRESTAVGTCLHDGQSIQLAGMSDRDFLHRTVHNGKISQVSPFFCIDLRVSPQADWVCYFKLMARICSPYPGIILSQTCTI